VREKKMIIAVTGTPGTGKTSVCKSRSLGREFDFLDLNRVVKEKGFYTGVDNERGGCLVADLEKLWDFVRSEERVEEGGKEGGRVVLIESHLSHLLSPEVAVVLRANPALLAERLKQKGFSGPKIRENLEAEVLDIILAEAVERCGVVYEVDTSGKSVEEVASAVREIVLTETAGSPAKGNLVKAKQKSLKERHKPGSVDWSSFVDLFF